MTSRGRSHDVTASAGWIKTYLLLSLVETVTGVGRDQTPQLLHRADLRPKSFSNTGRYTMIRNDAVPKNRTCANLPTIIVATGRQTASKQKGAAAAARSVV